MDPNQGTIAQIGKLLQAAGQAITGLILGGGIVYTVLLLAC